MGWIDWLRGNQQRAKCPTCGGDGNPNQYGNFCDNCNKEVENWLDKNEPGWKDENSIWLRDDWK